MTPDSEIAPQLSAKTNGIGQALLAGRRRGKGGGERALTRFDALCLASEPHSSGNVRDTAPPRSSYSLGAGHYSWRRPPYFGMKVRRLDRESRDIKNHFFEGAEHGRFKSCRAYRKGDSIRIARYVVLDRVHLPGPDSHRQ